MDIAQLHTLLTKEGLSLLDEQAAEPITDPVRTVSRLRAAGHAPDLVATVVGQARLRERASAKFGPFAARMLFTRAGLEQATRLSVAAHHAARFREAGLGRDRPIADLGCGLGGDALGMAALGLRVRAVEADEVTAGLAAYNLAGVGDLVEVVQARAEDVSLADVDAVWLDPARRTAGHSETRRVEASAYSPPLEWALEQVREHAGGIKLGPGFDRAHIPEDLEAQWISADGSTLELVLWSGAAARPGVRRAALVLRGESAHEITGEGDASDEPPRALGAYVHEPDGAVIRARLIGDVARSLQAGMLHERIAYLTGDEAVTSPFVQTFRVRETLPADTRRLGQALRERGIGTLEIKKRGVDVDPAALRRSLKLRGDQTATLLLARTNTGRIAILADRV